MILLSNKYPCVPGGPNSFYFTDYNAVYEVEKEFKYIEQLEIRELKFEDNQLIVKVPLVPSSKMNKIAFTADLKKLDIEVTEFMQPLLEIGNTKAIKVFLKIINDIELKLLEGNPVEELRKELKNPEDLVRNALLANLNECKETPKD